MKTIWKKILQSYAMRNATKKIIQKKVWKKYNRNTTKNILK